MVNILQLKTLLDAGKPLSIRDITDEYNRILDLKVKPTGCSSCNRQRVFKAYNKLMNSSTRYKKSIINLLADYDSLSEGEFLNFKRVNNIYNKVFSLNESNEECYDCYLLQIKYLKEYASIHKLYPEQDIVVNT